jgi:MFS family permease
MDNTLSGTGRQTLAMAQAWLVLSMTDSDIWVGVVNGIPAIPIAALTLFGGTLADRMDRRTMLIGIRLLLVVLGLITAILITTETVELWHLVLLSLTIAIVLSFGLTASQAIVVDIVGKSRLMSANGMYSVSINGASFAGPALGGLVVAWAGVEAAYFLFVVMIAIAAGFVALMKFEQPENPGAAKSIREDFMAGATYIWSTPVLRWLLLLAMFVLFIGVYSVALPRLSRDELGLDAAGYGALLASGGIGGLVGAASLIGFGNRRTYALALTGSCLIWSTFVIAFSFVTSQATAIPIAFCAGFTMPWWGNTIRTCFQVASSDEMRGRAASLFTLAVQMIVFGWFVGGIISDAIGPRPTIFVAGVTPAVVYIYVYMRSADFRQLGRSEL